MSENARYYDPRKPRPEPVRYMRPGKGDPAPPTSGDYFPTSIVGRCTTCFVVGTLDFPPGTFNWNVGDNLMSFASIPHRVLCLRCKAERDFLPVNPQDLDPEDQKVLVSAQLSMIEQARMADAIEDASEKGKPIIILPGQGG